MTPGPPEEHLHTQEQGTLSSADQTPDTLHTAQEPSRRRLNVSPAVAGLLGVLALGAAVGGWYLATSGNAAQSPVVQDTAISSAPSAPSTAAGTAARPMTAPGRPPVTGAPGRNATSTASAAPTVIPASPATDSPVVSAQPTSVDAIPPLSSSAAPGIPGRTGGASPATEAGGPPGAGLQAPGGASAAPGINPADLADTAPSANPFRPLRVTGAAQPGAASRTVQTKPFTAASATPLPSVSLPNTGFAGAVPMPMVPLGGLNTSPAQTSGYGAAGQATSPGGQTVGVGGVLPLPTLSLGGLARPMPTLTAAPRPKPIPRVSLNVPALPDLTGPGLTAYTGTDLLTYSRALQAPDAQPAFLTSATYGYDGQITSPGAPVSALAAYLAAHAVKFTAVVLGPLNTAVFSTVSDTLVLNTGAALPDSGPVLTRLTGSAATLSLGSESITLDLTTGAP